MSAPTTNFTDLEIDIRDAQLTAIERWAAGAAGPCAVCDIEVLEGSDCPNQHYNEARDLTENGINLAKAVNLLRAQP